MASRIVVQNVGQCVANVVCGLVARVVEGASLPVIEDFVAFFCGVVVEGGEEGGGWEEELVKC